MPITGKTKIVRGDGGELFFQRCVDDAGGVRWLEFRKDVSALDECNRERKFTDQFTATADPVASLQLRGVRNIPADFTTDLLSPYAKHQYASGHAPAPKWRI